MPTPKLLIAVRVTKLLIYSHTPSKLGDVGQILHTVFFFYIYIIIFYFKFYNTKTYNNTLTLKLLAAIRVIAHRLIINNLSLYVFNNK